jgi:hypothetical protein
MGMVHEKNRDRKSCANVPLKSSEYKKKHLGVKKIKILSYFEAKNMPKIAEVKLSSRGLEVADFR